MGARHGSEDVDDDKEASADRKRILEELESRVSGREFLSGVPRSNHHDHQHGAADELADQGAPGLWKAFGARSGDLRPHSRVAAIISEIAALERGHRRRESGTPRGIRGVGSSGREWLLTRSVYSTRNFQPQDRSR